MPDGFSRPDDRHGEAGGLDAGATLAAQFSEDLGADGGIHGCADATAETGFKTATLAAAPDRSTMGFVILQTQW